MVVMTPSVMAATGTPTTHQAVEDMIPPRGPHLMLAAPAEVDLGVMHALTALVPTPSVMAAPGTPTTHPAVVITIPPLSPLTSSAADAKVAAMPMTSTPRMTTMTTITATTMATEPTTTVIAQVITPTLTPSETVATSTRWLHPNADTGTMDTPLPIPLAALAVVDTDQSNQSSQVKNIQT